MADRFIVAAVHEWNRRVFEEDLRHLPGRWELCQSIDSLDEALGTPPTPRYVFFLHWSWKVPSKDIRRFECVNFHMTDLPYGRGGSPLQNLIMRGHSRTKLTAIRMTEEMDAGPVYLKQDLDLSGRAVEIYERASRIAAEMIAKICDQNPVPVPQHGEAVVFKRRTPAESRLPTTAELGHLYDFIRMLDAPGYPHAFVENGEYSIELTEASLDDGRLTARAEFVRRKEQS